MRITSKMIMLLVVISGIAIKLTAAFSSHIASKKLATIASRIHERIHPSSSQLQLVPLSKVWDSAASERCESFSTLVPKLGCKSLDINGALVETSNTSSNYKLYLATNIYDLPPITQLTLEVFDATAITLSSTSDWSAFEKAVVGAVVEPAISMYNSYANAVGYIEVLSGLRRRLSRMIVEVGENNALSPLVLPDGSTNKLITGKLSTIEEIAAQSSLILVLARDTNDGNSQAAASIELRLQPTDAKIPFSQPWLDSVERKIVRLFPFVHRNNDSSKPPMRPYLCNLCVSENLRGLGIGRALCRLVEAIACQQWGYDHLYLHVDPSNDAARILYEKEGYKDVGKRWSVIWAGGADGIGYYVKKLR